MYYITEYVFASGHVDTGKCSKISNTFLFLFSNKMLVLGLEFIKMLAE